MLHRSPANNFSMRNVVECWLPGIQGMMCLATKFVKCGINGQMLANLTKEFCMGTLGIKTMQAKKLVMASWRLARQGIDYLPGTVFNSSKVHSMNYSFLLGQGHIVRAMDLAAW
jgi:hypothetical protein